MPDTKRDKLSHFLFENADVRGEIVQLDQSWQQVLERHDYPPRLQNLLGEMMSAAVLLMGILKFKGKLILQLKGEGAVTMGLVECSSDRTLRGLIHWTGDIDSTAGLQSLLADNGVVAITLEQEPQGKKQKTERYQGIVEVVGDSLAASLQHYLQNSEQLETRLWLAADEKKSAGLLLQRMPSQQQSQSQPADDDVWPRLIQLSETISDEELLSLPAGEVIHRLYHQEDVRLFPAKTVAFHCTCSRQRVENTLRMVGEAEIKSVLAEKGSVQVDCEFCREHYRFDAVDVAALFAASTVTDSPVTLQ
jgi:molecular chaperone Hsp33